VAPRLKFMTVDDFRSIRGPVGVSLDAPVVLIHGPNGTGKTSLLAAIELALTGSVPSLARLDDEYMSYLPHKLGRSGLGRVSIQADDAGTRAETSLEANGRSVVGTALLDGHHARFYAERCYLAQATLGRLLEIYEHQDSTNSASPLTRFVKEMLGLDALDALIDGLHAVGDVRRFRETAPLFWAGRADTPKLEQAVSEARKLEQVRRDEMMKTEVALRQLLGPTVPEDHVILIGTLRAVLENEIERHESRLGELARMRRDLAGAGDQVREALASDEVAEQVQAEQASSVAREALERWRATSGTELNVIVAAAQKRFPNVISAEADPVASQAMATAAVRAALERTQNALINDDAIVQSLAEVQISIRQGKGRIEQIDAELVSAGGANRALAEALTAIASHIEDELCPVCGRDFAEVSATPLAAHVSEEVARLVAAAGRVEALVRDRTTTSTAVVAAERREADFLARRLPKERRDQLILEQAELTEWMNSLEVLADRATTGMR
jgi:DNA repair protein SbcC/Rad50